MIKFTKGSSKNLETGGEGGVARIFLKLVSRATLKEFVRDMHGHGRSRGEGGGRRDFLRIFRSRGFWTVPKVS